MSRLLSTQKCQCVPLSQQNAGHCGIAADVIHHKAQPDSVILVISILCFIPSLNNM